MELAVVAECEEEVAAVGAHAWHAGALTHPRRIYHQLRFAEGTCDGIVRHGVDVVEKAVVLQGYLTGGSVVEGFGQGGGAVVECLAVGCPAGEGFQGIVGAQDMAHAVGFGIVEEEVGGLVEDFNLLGVVHVEHLTCLVRGEGHEGLCGVP